MSLPRRSIVKGLLSLGLGASGSIASAQAWPAKPIRIVVPYSPGGSSDIIARAISQGLSEALKQPVIVENKAGANGNLGADFVAKSTPDGYTLLLCDTGALAISPAVYTKLGFFRSATQALNDRYKKDRKSTRLNSSHRNTSRMPSSA